MRTIETSAAFPLSGVKPLDRLADYRRYCLAQTTAALREGGRRRDRSPVGGGLLEPYGDVEGLPYGRDPENGSLFLAQLPRPSVWASLLTRISQYRNSPSAFHTDIAQSRTDHVYAPKLEWMRDTLRLQGLGQPRVLEAVTAPSLFTHLLRENGLACEVVTVEEMGLISSMPKPQPCEAAVLLESLDRVDDPAALIEAVSGCLVDGGLLFVTALVASGFDVAVLGTRNLYLYPPDRANCFSLQGLSALLERYGFTLLEVSTPGVLDVEIVQTHCQRDPTIPLSPFERQLLQSEPETRQSFQTFLQQRGMSSFARLVGRKG